MADFKTQLAQLLQKMTGRSLKREDVVYTTVANGGRFQASVKLVCTTGAEYAGELCANTKEAHQSAAAFALGDFAAEIAAAPPKAPKPRRERAAAKPPSAQLAPMAVPMSKTELAQKLQAYCKRSMTRADVVYETAKTPDGGFQSTVKLMAVGGVEFAGEVSTGEKLAQHSAAQQALVNISMWSNGVAASAPTAAAVAGTKRKAAAAPQPGSNPKSELAEFLMKHIKRTMMKGDIVYAASQCEGGGYQATVELVCHMNRQFAGEVCETGKLAEAAAAHQALLAVMAELGEPAPKQKRQKVGAELV